MHSQKILSTKDSTHFTRLPFSILRARPLCCGLRGISENSEPTPTCGLGRIFAWVHRPHCVNCVVTASSHALSRVLLNKVIWVLGHCWVDTQYIYIFEGASCLLSTVTVTLSDSNHVNRSASFIHLSWIIFITNELVDRIKNFRWIHCRTIMKKMFYENHAPQARFCMKNHALQARLIKQNATQARFFDKGLMGSLSYWYSM